MSQKRELEAKILAILHSRSVEENDNSQLSALTEARLDQFGNIIFVRKGAPVDFEQIRPSDRIDIPDLHDIRRVSKRKRFLQLKGDHTYHGPLILAEGDSWFEYPYSKDLLVYAGKEYAVLSLARAGDTWDQIRYQDSDPEQKYSDGTPMGLIHTLKLPDPRPFDYVMLSVGGNDLIGQIRFCVHKFDAHRPEDDYIIHDGLGFDFVLDQVIANYRAKIDAIVALGKPVILHTYDYPNPKNNGPNIGHPLKRYCKFPDGSEALMRRTVNQMIDLFHDELAKLAAASNGKVHLINLRNTIGTDDYLNGPDPNLWEDDEMHGNSEGFRRLWVRMDTELKKIFRKP